MVFNAENRLELKNKTAIDTTQSNELEPIWISNTILCNLLMRTVHSDGANSISAWSRTYNNWIYYNVHVCCDCERSEIEYSWSPVQAVSEYVFARTNIIIMYHVWCIIIRFTYTVRRYARLLNGDGSFDRNNVTCEFCIKNTHFNVYQQATISSIVI